MIFNKADILIPDCELENFSVVACDQYTSQKDYWDRVSKRVEGKVSARHIIFPEAYLATSDFDKTVSAVNNKMAEYLENDVFKTYKDSIIYVKRTFNSGAVRHGIVGAVDLEEYDYSKDSTSMVRATERTVPERIPARVRIRENAPIELPHVLLLIDDKANDVFSSIKMGEKLYDFTLMEDGGKIEGYLIENADDVLRKLHALPSNPLIAVGDGNHSLAGAKATWENLKKTLSDDEKENHPSRFALAELGNLYDESLVFEPIYRVLFASDPVKVLDAIKKEDGKFTYTISYVYENGEGEVTFKSDSHVMAGAITEFLESYIENNGGEIDYVHGIEATTTLGKAKGNIAFFPECLKKEDLFTSVEKFGPLPKKTFSMGHAEEKRFYLEARKLTY